MGTPAELYDRPANLFAATFIGSPQMNIINGRIEREGNNLLFRTPGISLDVTARKSLQSYVGMEVTAGIRPESLLPGEGPLSGRIELIENLGAEIILHVRCDTIKLVARLVPDFEKNEEDVVSFRIAAKGVHFFHKSKRIQ